MTFLTILAFVFVGSVLFYVHGSPTETTVPFRVPNYEPYMTDAVQNMNAAAESQVQPALSRLQGTDEGDSFIDRMGSFVDHINSMISAVKQHVIDNSEMETEDDVEDYDDSDIDSDYENDDQGSSDINDRIGIGGPNIVGE
ncbi:uncharacterized protein LOC114246517 [Bombyx mandarina]|uniref:Uncharacterized protein LOC114246517 n=1 Tax=Bombyx mandarina TaxID=7092 RepID=A0A6J2K1K4_BOMMA|nr:uncharacterized protein LOC114246517 [Bombyx mandarina]